ncbi:FliI/YscN family ATPase [Oceanidesulfovibrio marinus]|uniref:Flagellum-specific ATP synthase FliI n=1 Tax=Oceanidesulfovibrio marinus TaxID=370038 RepID=A0A6P1ZC09_9BACT|nr:FliI/YscN family ATPase [Oceanidesulfovibrio marinus]QJT10494.1 FliI/YscN family ATPase [Oceanidesulfovibrio marinus]TVM30184.1 flagellum-specific ATP synthase FliI [Oceanidesulfovibrio marinus]
MNPAAAARMLDTASPCRTYGKVCKVVGMIAEGCGIRAPLGTVCALIPDGEGACNAEIAAEIVGFKNDAVLFMPYGDMRGIQPGSLIRSDGAAPLMPVGDAFLGRAVDAFGRPLDGNSGPIAGDDRYPLFADPPNPLSRPRISDPLDVGVRAINGLLTLGKGQRVGIMAGSGVGKSTLMGMMARYTKADVNVIALVGERGREVVEFIEKDLGPEGMARSVLVVATSDQSPLVRMRAAYAATSVAEYFRDQGKDVLLMMDSVTRFAMAAREVGLAVGEPPTSRGYTPSVFAHLPKLLERAGRSEKGTITGIYTVLVDGDDFNEPIADSTRSILDGHIVLTRDLADKGHFPAIDVLRSISRLRSDVTPDDVKDAGRDALRHLATFKRVEDMVNIGAYSQGSNPEIDKALQMVGPLNEYLRQPVGEQSVLSDSFTKLTAFAAS